MNPNANTIVSLRALIHAVEARLDNEPDSQEEWAAIAQHLKEAHKAAVEAKARAATHLLPSAPPSGIIRAR